MKAILMQQYGGPGVLQLGEAPDPVMGDGDLLISVRAAALNRADLLQRRGHYPPLPGAPDILGLEAAGEVAAVGSAVTGWRPGDRVCALLPEGFSFEQGAAVPEAFLTAYLNLFWLGQLAPGGRVLVHAGASGVGTAAIQLIREAGAAAYATAGTAAKLERCLELGAVSAWNYREGSFAGWVAEATQGRGVDIVLDFVGAPYFEDNLKSLAVGGRLIVIGTMGGDLVNGFRLGQLLGKRLQIIGTTLRSRSVEEKIRLSREFAEFALPRFRDGRLTPVIDTVFSWEDAVKAHEYMESNANIGKIVLRIGEPSRPA